MNHSILHLKGNHEILKANIKPFLNTKYIKHMSRKKQNIGMKETEGISHFSVSIQQPTPNVLSANVRMYYPCAIKMRTFAFDMSHAKY